MVQIIPSNSASAPLDLMNTHIQGNADDPWSTCPWVKVGNLYMSITQTATKSWWPLVTELQKGSASRVTVVSGRHGTQAGQAVSTRNGTWNPEKVIEPKFYETDVASAVNFPGVQVEDAGRINSTDTLKGLTKLWLNAGPVIYGWCHSLFSMMDHDEFMYDRRYKKLDRDSGNTKWIVAESRALWLSSKSVGTLAQEWYDWV